MSREDENGHLIDENDQLIPDDRCYWCLAEDAADRGVTIIRVDMP